ncbi:hypothetical protein RI129_001264 [Pyrocoelia pectoralis]|uniref:Retrotransposon gag domain-containing protein n=1 Tax=Pyrocoelia pectoralis TaxID=417401 RepID=A0AAN7VMJ2_9COLE
MSHKIIVTRLDKDELEYELRVRGIGTGTVDEMRRSLSAAIQLEKSGESIRYPVYPFSFQEDSDGISSKLDTVRRFMSQLSAVPTSNEAEKLRTKLSHMLNRIDFMNATTEDESHVISQLLASTLSLLNQLQPMNKPAEEEIPPNITIVEQQQVTLEPVLESTRVEDNANSLTYIRPILPNKWDLKYSGDSKGMSLSAFLERVEVLRKARRVSQSILLESGIDLFTGRAYQFYLDYREEVNTWEELVALLKEEFHTSDYNERLFEEIKKRTQGPDESVGIYIAVMTGYFKRLTCSVSEATKLKILMRNLAPFYQSQLGLVDILSIAELKRLCRRLEERRTEVDNYRSPSLRTSLLEPDLGYVGLEDHAPSACVNTSSISDPIDQHNLPHELAAAHLSLQPHTSGSSTRLAAMKCWNCNTLEHTNRFCTAQRRFTAIVAERPVLQPVIVLGVRETTPGGVNRP